MQPGINLKIFNEILSKETNDTNPATKIIAEIDIAVHKLTHRQHHSSQKSEYVANGNKPVIRQTK